MDQQGTDSERAAEGDRVARYGGQSQPGADDLASALVPPVPPTRTPARWLRILQKVTDGAVVHLDMQELVRELLGRVRESMDVDNVAILLTSADGQHLDLYAALGPEESAAGMVQIPIGRGVAGTIAATGMPVIINDLSQVDVENPLLRATARSLVGAPLLVGDQVIGVIHIDSARPRHFTEEDSQLLQVIASRVALAIEHAQLYDDERRARQRAEMLMRKLQALQAVSDVALEYAELNELLRALLLRIQEILQVDNVAILLPTPDGTELTLYSVQGPEETVIGKVHVPMGEGVAGLIAATRQPLIVENLTTVPVANPFLKAHFHSLLGVPLLSGEQLVGVIHVDSVEPRRFTAEESQMLQTLAERIATAITRSQQYERAEHKRTQAEQHSAMLQDTVERMDEFLSLASHELRTPLTSLAMNIQLLDYWLYAQRARRPDEEEGAYLTRAIATVRPFIQRSGHGIKRLNRLVGDLLDATYTREERLPLRRQRMDLVKVAHDVVEEQQQIAASRKLALETGPLDVLYVNADPDRIAQVITNFISNALKYSGARQPVRVVTQIKGDRARLAVRDTGVGIPRAEMERVWARHYRVAGIEHQSGSGVGLGLGLYISRDIIERHGGQIGVQSAPGEGSTFWFELPLAHP